MPYSYNLLQHGRDIGVAVMCSHIREIKKKTSRIQNRKKKNVAWAYLQHMHL